MEDGNKGEGGVGIFSSFKAILNIKFRFLIVLPMLISYFCLNAYHRPVF